MTIPSSWRRLQLDLRSEPAPAGPPLPGTIGRYPILSEISRTGASVVYLARDPALKRQIAIKVLREECAPPDFLQRFRREGVITASLRHPHIVAIHEVGEAEGPGGLPVRYIAMDYIEGGTLADRRLDPRGAAEAMAVVADAVDHAHRGGVIHRDLKPGNVLVDSQGRPVVTDFGLAKSIDAASVVTQQGTIMGTPQYMPPEQVRGDSGQVGPPADVYALGAILYELLARVPPHFSESTAGLFEKILHEEPRPPSSLVAGVPKPLEAVVLKAIEKDPDRRYATAAEMAQELRRFLAGEPVLARSPSIVTSLWRRAVRRRAVVAPLAVALAFGLLAAVWLLASARKKAAQVRDNIADAARWEKEGEFLKARDAYRRVIDFEEGHAAAQEGFRRADAALARKRDEPSLPPPAAPHRPWVELGGSATGGGISRTPSHSFQCSLAVDVFGQPVVAWRELSGGNDDIHLRRWEGGAWAALGASASGGGLSNAPGYSRFPAVLGDDAGHPIVAWDDVSGGNLEIRLLRWNNKAWEGLGPSATESGISGSSAEDSAWPALAKDSGDIPLVAWTELDKSTSSYRLRTSRWDKSQAQWKEYPSFPIVGGSLGSTGPSERPGLAVDADDRPIVAWRDLTAGNFEIYLMRWTGSAWEEIGGSATGGGVSSAPGLSITPSVAVDKSGKIVVSWLDDASGNEEIRLKRWNGAAWEELGGSATGGGISRTPGASHCPSMALDPAGHPLVAWQDNSRGNSEIYLRRWDGSAWIELAGSATGGGISDTPGASEMPSLAVDALGNPYVAWYDYVGADNAEVYLRHWEGAAPSDLAQYQGETKMVLVTGSFTGGGDVTLVGSVASAAEGLKVRLEVEVRPSHCAFEGFPTSRSQPVDSGARVPIVVAGLASGKWHWRARAVDSLGMTSPWISYGGNADGAVDFEIRDRSGSNDRK